MEHVSMMECRSATNQTNSEVKRAAFDDVMKEYLRKQGLDVATSILNVVRETALAAVNAEAEQSAS